MYPSLLLVTCMNKVAKDALFSVSGKIDLGNQKIAVLYASSDALLHSGSHAFRCALGRRGIGWKKHEGDGVTPKGRYPMRRLLYRADRMYRPNTKLPVHKIEAHDGWCDDPSDSAYNRPVKLPYKASAEKLWRHDSLYDLVVILGYNDDPVVPYAGSAIFLHVASIGYGPTEGCIAVSLRDLLALLPNLDRDSKIQIDI